MSVENSVKQCDGVMKQCVVGQNIPLPDCSNAISSMRQRGDGKLVECESCERESNRNTRISAWCCFCAPACVYVRNVFFFKSRAAPGDEYQCQRFPGLPKQSEASSPLRINNQDKKVIWVFSSASLGGEKKGRQPWPDSAGKLTKTNLK